VLGIASIVMMTVDHRQHYLDNVRALLSVVVYPIQYAVDLPFSAGNWMGENMATRSTVMEENSALRSQIMFVKAQLQKLSALEVENIRLRKLLDASQRLTDRAVAAELISMDMDPLSHKVLINKGERQNVQVGQPVLDANGVFGQIISVTPFNSTVMLISDPNHALPVQINRSGLRGLLSGTGIADALQLLHVPNNADVKVGDVLVTSGLGGIFPAGYPVGEISSFQPSGTEPYATVRAKPTAHLEGSREVLVVFTEQEPLTTEMPATTTPEAPLMAPEDEPVDEAPDGAEAVVEPNPNAIPAP